MGAVSNDPDKWGVFGDYLGGTLNPVFGFLTIIALVLTLILQSNELRMSREELELSREELSKSAVALAGQNKVIDKQSFEQTFFSWLDTYGEVLVSIEHNINQESKRGGAALMHWWNYALSWKTSPIRRNRELNLPERYELIQPNKITDISMEARGRWEALYKEHEYQLDNLFRVLYRLILWIHSQDDNRISPAQKWLYVSIVRARLSWIEMVYLFYNAQTKQGEKFKALIEQYALFDNLNFDSDNALKAVREFPHDSVGYKPSAYDSKIARVDMGLPESGEETLAMASDK